MGSWVSGSYGGKSPKQGKIHSCGFYDDSIIGLYPICQILIISFKTLRCFGLYDRKFMNALKQYRDPVPYLRGFVSQIGFKQTMVEFVQPEKKTREIKA